MFSVKVVDLSTTYQMPLPFVAPMCVFLDLKGAEKAPAQNRTFQSPPGIWLTLSKVKHQVTGKRDTLNRKISPLTASYVPRSAQVMKGP